MSNLAVSTQTFTFPVSNPGGAPTSGNPDQPPSIGLTLTGADPLPVSMSIDTTDGPPGVFTATLQQIAIVESGPNVGNKTTTTIPTNTGMAVTSGPLTGTATLQPLAPPSPGADAVSYVIQISLNIPPQATAEEFKATLNINWGEAVSPQLTQVTLAGSSAQLTAVVETQPITLLAGGWVDVPVKITYASVDPTPVQFNLGPAILGAPPTGLTISLVTPTPPPVAGGSSEIVKVRVSVDPTVQLGTVVAYMLVTYVQFPLGLNPPPPVKVTFDILRPPIVFTPAETCMRSVTVGHVGMGASVEVYVNNNPTPIGSANAQPNDTQVEVPISAGSLPLHALDSIYARQTWQGLQGQGEPVQVVSPDGFYYHTQHYNTERQGWFPYETTLTVDNVRKSLKLLFTQPLDGTVYAQPLYAHHVYMSDRARAYNVIYVATENNTVYAFDADASAQEPKLWTYSVMQNGETPVPGSDVCSTNIRTIGITSTPVIEPGSYTMWVVAKTKGVDQNGNASYHYRLWALDIATGQPRPGPNPNMVEIEATYQGTASPQAPNGKGNVVLFEAKYQLNRPGLLLLNGLIYVAFGSHNDANTDRYHGWVMAYDKTSLKQVGAFCTTPNNTPGNCECGGIWQSGIGLAADPEGYVYFVSGNGDFDGDKANFSSSTVKLAPPSPGSDFMEVADFFTPSNQGFLGTNDWDFGSGGAMIFPDPPADKNLPKTLVACGKDGNIYLLNRQNMGGYNPAGPPNVLTHLPLQPGRPVPLRLTVEQAARAGKLFEPGGKLFQPGAFGGPAFFDNGEKQFVYYAGSDGPMTAFFLEGNSLEPAGIGVSGWNFSGGPGCSGGTTPVVSSNQNKEGIVWALLRFNPYANPQATPQVILLAFDATDLTQELIAIPAGPWNNPKGTAFIEPTVINGRVYVASDGELRVFGL